MKVLEVIAECGIAIAFIAIVVWLPNNSAQNSRKCKEVRIKNGVVGKRGSMSPQTNAIP